MRRLKRPRPGRRAQDRLGDDRGAVVATLAIVLGAGVLLGMAAVVVDVGRLYAEREQLQSGADAAAWAVAETCVREPERCGAGLAAARWYANANAADGAAEVTSVCGRGPGLPACGPAATNRTACLGDAPADTAYAEVRTRTLRPDGGALLPGTFARAVSGEPDTAVAACARVAWGPPRTARGLAVTFSTCEWNELTGDGSTFWPAPEDGLPPASAERVVRLKDNTATTCGAGPSGWDAPGGFGWLDDADGTCSTTVSVDGSFGGSTGNSVSSACRAALADLRDRRRPTLIPIYDGVRGNGANTTYHLAGFASFVPTGYYLSGLTSPSWLTGRHACRGQERCLYGYFTRGLVPTAGAEIGGPDLGVSIVNMVG